MSGRSRKYGRHRSLVRLIGTALPLKPCRRTCTSIFYVENKSGQSSRFESSDPYNGAYDFDTWSKDLKSNAPDVISSMKFSTPKEDSTGKYSTREVSAEKFAALQEQVLQLQAEIAKILSNQLLKPMQVCKEQDRWNGKLFGENIQECIGSKPVLSMNSNEEHPASQPPPPPPPPPPPLPPFSLPTRPLVRSQSLTSETRQQSENQPHIKPVKRHSSTIPHDMSEVLKNLGSVKLRHVERSPGGTPLRRRPRTPPNNDVGSALAAALKRRFAHLMPDDCSPDCTQLNDSSPNKSFENREQVSFIHSQQTVGTMKI